MVGAPRVETPPSRVAPARRRTTAKADASGVSRTAQLALDPLHARATRGRRILRDELSVHVQRTIVEPLLRYSSAWSRYEADSRRPHQRSTPPRGRRFGHVSDAARHRAAEAPAARATEPHRAASARKGLSGERTTVVDWPPKNSAPPARRAAQALEQLLQTRRPSRTSPANSRVFSSGGGPIRAPWAAPGRLCRGVLGTRSSRAAGGGAAETSARGAAAGGDASRDVVPRSSPIAAMSDAISSLRDPSQYARVPATRTTSVT